MRERVGGILGGVAEGAVVGLVVVGEVASDASEAADVVEEVIVGDAHAGGEVARVAGRGSEVFTVEEEVIAGDGVGEDGVAVVAPVGVAAGDVELDLGLAVVAGAGAVFGGGVLFAEKVVGDVFDGVEAEAIGMGFIDEPAEGAEEHGVDVLFDGIAHVVDAIAKAPGGNAAGRVGVVDAGVGEGFGGFAKVVLPVGVGVVEIEAAVVVEVFVGFLVGEGVERIVVEVVGNDEASVGVEVGASGVADADPFGVVFSFLQSVGIKGGVGVFLGDVPGEGVAVEDLPFVTVIDGVIGLAPAAAFGADEMEVLGDEAGDVGEKISGFGVAEVAAVVGHHVVEINLEPEAVGDAHEGEEFGLGAIFGADGAGLVDVAEVEAVECVEAHRVRSRGSFEGRGKPERGVAGLRDFGEALLDLLPGGAEILENGFFRPGVQ